jgi:hypothetical protein
MWSYTSTSAYNFINTASFTIRNIVLVPFILKNMSNALSDMYNIADETLRVADSN